MKTKILVCAAGIAMLASAAEPLAQTDKAFAQNYAGVLCDKKACVVMIKVTDACTFTVTPFTLGVKARNYDAKITWKIDTSNSKGVVEFPTNGGVFFKGTDEAKKEFGVPKAVSSTEYEVIDKNPSDLPQKARAHSYGIKVMQDRYPCTLDPTIVNDY